MSRGSSGVNLSDLTLKEAVGYLSHPEENFQQCGANFIQHTTFKEESAKQEVKALAHKYTINTSCTNTPSKQAQREDCFLACCRDTSSGMLCEDLCVTCLEGMGGESYHHRTWLQVVFVTYGVVDVLPRLTRFPLCISVLQVFQLGGIPALVTILRSTNPGVNKAAAGALRNLVFKNLDNKLEVQHCGGIAKALQLLKETDSTETRKQITGRQA